MGKLSKEERADLEARLAADDEADDDGDEVELGFADGSHFRGPLRRARTVAKARGYKLDPDPEPGEKGDGKDDGKGDGKTVRFAGRRVS